MNLFGVRKGGERGGGAELVIFLKGSKSKKKNLLFAKNPNPNLQKKIFFVLGLELVIFFLLRIQIGNKTRGP